MQVLDLYFTVSLENTAKSLGIGELKTCYLFVVGLHLILAKKYFI